MRERRWFRGKARTIKATKVTDAIPVHGAKAGAILVTLAVDYSEGESEQYLLPVREVPPPEAARILIESPGQMIAQVTGPNGRDRGALVDAALDPEFMTVLLDAVPTASGHGRRRSRG
jgi:maltose alpha-D-glucosyltransferase/alpha-amylase